MDSAAQTDTAGNGAEFSFRLKPITSEASGVRGTKHKGVFGRAKVKLSFELEARSSLGGAAYMLLVVAFEVERAELDALVGFQLGELQSREHVGAVAFQGQEAFVNAFAELLIEQELVQVCTNPASTAGVIHAVGSKRVRCATAITSVQTFCVTPTGRRPCARCFADLWASAGGQEALRSALVLLVANGGQS